MSILHPPWIVATFVAAGALFGPRVAVPIAAIALTILLASMLRARVATPRGTRRSSFLSRR